MEEEEEGGGLSSSHYTLGRSLSASWRKAECSDSTFKHTNVRDYDTIMFYWAVRTAQ